MSAPSPVPAPAGPRRRRSWIPVAVGVAVLVVIGAAALSWLTAREDGATNVRLDPVNTAGENPFTPPMGSDQTGVAPPPDAAGTYPGDTAGLYGGSLNGSRCDAPKLVAYLRAHPDKAAAWASVLGIAPQDIPGYVAGLTPATLRSDTFVTNHGYDQGRAVPVPAVLQAGTAVLVDKHGAPVTKCLCGNPLTRPPAATRVVYVGPSWQSFTTTSITVIARTTVITNTFIMVDASRHTTFSRPAGTNGQRDVVLRSGPPSSSLPSPSMVSPPESTQAPESASATGSESASGSAPPAPPQPPLPSEEPIPTDLTTSEPTTTDELPTEEPTLSEEPTPTESLPSEDFAPPEEPTLSEQPLPTVELSAEPSEEPLPTESPTPSAEQLTEEPITTEESISPEPT